MNIKVNLITSFTKNKKITNINDLKQVYYPSWQKLSEKCLTPNFVAWKILHKFKYFQNGSVLFLWMITKFAKCANQRKMPYFKWKNCKNPKNDLSKNFAFC